MAGFELRTLDMLSANWKQGATRWSKSHGASRTQAKNLKRTIEFDQSGDGRPRSANPQNWFSTGRKCKKQTIFVEHKRASLPR